MHKKVKVDKSELSLDEIFRNGSSPASYFQVKKEVLPLIRRFFHKDMITSDIFKYVWQKNLASVLDSHNLNGLHSDPVSFISNENVFKKCFDELLGSQIDEYFSLPELPMRINEILVYILLPSLNHSLMIMHQFISGDITIKDALSFTQNPSCRIKEELVKLSSFFEVTFIDSDQIERCSNRLRCVSDMKSCRQQSVAILKTAKALDLQGDFDNVTAITGKVCDISRVQFAKFPNIDSNSREIH